jgi:hypothetical protein
MSSSQNTLTQFLKLNNKNVLTFINSITKIAFPFFIIYEKYKWIDVGATHSTADNRGAADNRKILKEKSKKNVKRVADKRKVKALTLKSRYG